MKTLCKFADTCPDILRLENAKTVRRVDEDLAEQYFELCNAPSGDLNNCLNYQEFRKESLMER